MYDGDDGDDGDGSNCGGIEDTLYRNQASSSADNPLGLDTSLRSYSAGTGVALDRKSVR